MNLQILYITYEFIKFVNVCTMHIKCSGKKKKESYVFVVSDAGIAGNAWMSKYISIATFSLPSNWHIPGHSEEYWYK